MIAEEMDHRIVPAHLDFEPAGAQGGVPIDPFGLEPGLASRLSGLGGAEPSPDAGYVFHTSTVGVPVGPTCFVVRFEGLAASGGWMLLRLIASSELEGGIAVTVRTVKLSVAEIAAALGEVRISFTGRRNILYSLACHLYDTGEASAGGLSVLAPGPVKLARRRRTARLDEFAEMPQSPVGAGEDDGMQAVPRLLSLDPPMLQQPVSQGWTVDQCKHQPFTELLIKAGLKPDPTPTNWEIAYLGQVLRRYGALKSGGYGLGVGDIEPKNPIPAWLAKHGCDVTVAAPYDKVPIDTDLGLKLEQLLLPGICPEDAFFNKVHITTMDVSSKPGALAHFDFIWSTRVSDHMSTVAEYQAAIEIMMQRLRPGGLAVHLFRLAHATGVLPSGALALARPDVERMVLALIAQGHAVAQLKFGYHEQSSLRGRVEIPFGVIVRASGKA